MANNNGGGGNDLYGVLGVNRDCSESELRQAYKKLALKWHPDRCFASGSSKAIEEAKNKFQAIRQAYSVLSDVNKRFLYDLGGYESYEDDDQNENGGEESMEELKQLFEQMTEADNVREGNICYASGSSSSSSSSSTYVSFKTTCNSSDFDINNVIGNSHESFHHLNHASNNLCSGIFNSCISLYCTCTLQGLPCIN